MIGLGRMAKALVWPLLDAQELPAEALVATVSRPSSLDDLNATWPLGVRAFLADAEGAELVWSAPLQLLAVKPQQLAQNAKIYFLGVVIF